MAEKIGQGLDWLEVLKLLGPNWGSTEPTGTPLTAEEMTAMRARNPGLVFLPANGEAESMEQLLEELRLAAEDAEEENYEVLRQKAEKQGPQILQSIIAGKPKHNLLTGFKDEVDPNHFRVNGEEPDLFTGLPEVETNSTWQTLKDMLQGGADSVSEAVKDIYHMFKGAVKAETAEAKKKFANWYDNPNEPDLFTDLPEDNRGTFERLTGVEPKYQAQFLKDFLTGTKDSIVDTLALKDLKAGMLGVGAGTEAAANAGADFLNKAGNKIGQWVFELTHKGDLQKLRESQAQKMQDALAAFGPSAETVTSEQKGPKSTPGEKPKAEDKSGYDWPALWTAVGSAIGNWTFDPRTGSLIRTDSNGPSIFDILKAKEDIRASKQKSQQPTALGGSAYYDPRTGEVVQTESDILKVARLQTQMAQDEEKRKNNALAAQLLAGLEPRERMKLMSEAMLAGKDKLDTNAYIIQRIQNAQNAKGK